MFINLKIKIMKIISHRKYVISKTLEYVLLAIGIGIIVFFIIRLINLFL